jgi:hypothetical protein
MVYLAFAAVALVLVLAIALRTVVCARAARNVPASDVIDPVVIEPVENPALVWLSTAETAVDVGVVVGRSTYQVISGVSFAILEAIPSTQSRARAVHATHDQIVSGVCGVLTSAGTTVGTLARAWLDA